MIRIRLKRIGKKRHPFYRLVVADKPDRRDGRFIETLGSYDPHANPPVVKVDGEKAKEWIGKGAQPSEAAEKILVRAGVIEKKVVRVTAAPKAAAKAEAPATKARAKAEVAVAEAPPKAEVAVPEAAAKAEAALPEVETKPAKAPSKAAKAVAAADEAVDEAAPEVDAVAKE